MVKNNIRAMNAGCLNMSERNVDVRIAGLGTADHSFFRNQSEFTRLPGLGALQVSLAATPMNAGLATVRLDGACCSPAGYCGGCRTLAGAPSF
jgi:hypothetical protein